MYRRSSPSLGSQEMDLLITCYNNISHSDERMPIVFILLALRTNTINCYWACCLKALVHFPFLHPLLPCSTTCKLLLASSLIPFPPFSLTDWSFMSGPSLIQSLKLVLPNYGEWIHWIGASLLMPYKTHQTWKKYSLLLIITTLGVGKISKEKLLQRKQHPYE